MKPTPSLLITFHSIVTQSLLITFYFIVTQSLLITFHSLLSGLCSAVGNLSDCTSRDRAFDPVSVSYFRGDWSWNNFYGHSPPFRWIIQEGLLSVTSESMCTKYWWTACQTCPGKSVVRWTDRPTMTIAVDLGRQATKQTESIDNISFPK